MFTCSIHYVYGECGVRFFKENIEIYIEFSCLVGKAEKEKVLLFALGAFKKLSHYTQLG